jgi:hypothetical protein
MTMAAIHLLSSAGIDARRDVGRGLCALVAALAAFGAFAQESVPAVLKARELQFMYRSSSVLFPCYELESRVAMILRGIGARDDLKVEVINCERFFITQDSAFGDDPFGRGTFERPNRFERPGDRFHNPRNRREQQSYVRVWLMAPVAVTPEVLAEIEKDKSRRELISRVTGNPAAAMNDPIIFAAQRQTVTLSRKTMELEPEDCELLEQMSRSIFRDLDVRVVRGTHACRSGRSLITPQVTIEALLPIGFHFVPQQEDVAPAPVPAPEAAEETGEPTDASPQN